MVDITADEAWNDAYHDVMDVGRIVAPRGKRVREVDHATVIVDMRYPVVTVRPDLNYRFMAAEALWIIDARDDVEYLAQFIPKMFDYSDDGRTLAGAYGPRIMDQIVYVVRKLREDRDTRQAALSIWKPNPMPSKNIPCTMAMTFQIRDDRLNAHVFMRSSDVWMGLPYDIFSFSMVAEWVRIHYNLVHGLAGDRAATGALYLTAASSHVYEEHWNLPIFGAASQAPPLPEWQSPEELRAHLEAITNSKRGDAARWWEA